MPESRIVRILFLTIVAEVISFAVIIPIVPLLFTEPSSPYFILPTGMSIDSGYILLGVLIGLYPLGQFLATPVLGEISDIYGRKRVMQLSITGTVIASLVFGIGLVVSSIPLLFASRVVNGLTGGLVSVSQATIADVTEAAQRSRNFGRIGAAFGLGFMFGPFLGGILSSDLHPLFSDAAPLWFAAGLSLVSLAYVTRALPETSPMERKPIDWMKPFSQLRRGLQLPGLRRLFGTNFFYFAGFAFFTTFAPVYLVRGLGFSQVQVGLFFLYVGTLVVLGQGVLVPIVFRRVDESRLMPLTLFLTGLFIAVQPVPDSVTLFMIAVTLFSVSNSLTTVSLNTLISRGAAATDQGLALGTNQSVRALGNAIPSMLSGVAAAAIVAEAPLYIAGLVIMATAIVYYLRERS